MKKLLALTAVAALTGTFSTLALAGADKTGFYITGKTGASVITLDNQRFSYGEGSDASKYKGGDKTDTVFGAGIAIGYDFYQHYNVPLRTEVEFYGRGNASSRYVPVPINGAEEPEQPGTPDDTLQNKLGVNTLMVNAYYDFRNSSAFTPWVSAGLGYARVHHKVTYTEAWIQSGIIKYDSSRFSGNENNLAWSLGVGVKYDVTPDFSLDLAYRYLDAGDSTLTYKDSWGDTYKSSVDVRSNEFTLGATYSF